MKIKVKFNKYLLKEITNYIQGRYPEMYPADYMWNYDDNDFEFYIFKKRNSARKYMYIFYVNIIPIEFYAEISKYKSYRKGGL